MSLLELPIPPRPTSFTPTGAPPGVNADPYAYDDSWRLARPAIRPRLIVVHTNGGSGEGTYPGAVGWSNSAPDRTHAHYNLNEPTPSKSLSTGLRSIANSTGREIELRYGERDVSFWSISIETADRGTANGGSVDLGDFLHDHAELLARIIAYESIIWDIPIEVPSVWNGAGVVTHTEPWPYPYYTTVRGKTCPGTTKKNRVLRGDILPRARQIRDAWTGITPPPTPDQEEDDMNLAIRWKHANHPDQYLCGVGGIERVTPGMVAAWRAADVLPGLVEEDDDAKLADCRKATGQL